MELVTAASGVKATGSAAKSVLDLAKELGVLTRQALATGRLDIAKSSDASLRRRFRRADPRRLAFALAGTPGPDVPDQHAGRAADRLTEGRRDAAGAAPSAEIPSGRGSE